MTSIRRRTMLFLAAFSVFVYQSVPANALDWIYIAPNPNYSRDLAMGASTLALSYAPQSASPNPAGLSLFDSRTPIRGTLFLNPGGLWQLDHYWRDEADLRSDLERTTDHIRLLTSGAAVQFRVITFAMLLSQPVMIANDSARYDDYERRTPLEYHQNSLQVSLALHPRISVGGRIDRYYRWDVPDEEGYSYGVIFRPRGIRLGVQYQRSPASGARVASPLDRRSDQTTSAGIALVRDDLTLSFQVMNLTESDQPAFLEPHGGIEWRPVRAIALRAGGMQFSRSQRWAWTTGIGLLDANWFRGRTARLLVPDDLLQIALGVMYQKRVPVLGIGTITCAWRF